MARKSPHTVRFTQTAVDSLTASENRVDWWDEDTPNLICRVSPTGSKVFYWVGRLRGEFRRLKLGVYPSYKIPQARDEARRITGEASEGKLPIPKASQNLAEMSLHKLWLWWRDFHAIPHRKNWKNDESRYNGKLSHWSTRKVSSITKEEVQILRDKVRDAHGPMAANAVLHLLGLMYRMGIEFEKIQCGDPTKGVKHFPNQQRERFLGPEELSRFFDAVSKQKSDVMRDFLLLSLFTGARRRNVAAMRWDQLDIKSKAWTIPKQSSKNKREMVIPLTQAAIDIIERRSTNSQSQWVLPGGGVDGHVTEPKHIMKRIMQEADLRDLRFHDLRRTLGSWLAEDTPLSVIAKQLGHSSTKSTSIYARIRLNKAREAADKATSDMLSRKKN